MIPSQGEVVDRKALDSLTVALKIAPPRYQETSMLFTKMSQHL